MTRLRNPLPPKYSVARAAAIARSPVPRILRLAFALFAALLAASCVMPAPQERSQPVEQSKRANTPPAATAIPPTATNRPIIDAAQSATIAPEPTRVITHTVAPGDTLTRIAARYNITVRELLDANDLPNPDLLAVGYVLKLPQVSVETSPGFRILPDSRLVRSVRSADFDTSAFVAAQPGALRDMTLTIDNKQYRAAQIIERASLEFSVDARILLAFLEHFAGLLTDANAPNEKQLYPLLSRESAPRRAGLYSQLSWLADRLNQGYYDWKYRGETQLRFADGNALHYDTALNAGAVAVQYALGQLLPPDAWKTAAGESGLHATYMALFGDPFLDAHLTVPDGLRQPTLTLPFPRGEVWRYTGGFHGGWGNGSAWAAIDFAPPEEAASAYACYESSFAATAAANGVIARAEEGLVVLDLDGDGDEATGWTILYLHIDHHDTLQAGQTIEAGNLLGYPDCVGGVSYATHLHIARRFNGEWIPADCARCPPAVSAPPFVMSDWRVVGLGSQLYQGFLVNQADNRSVVAEQGRHTDINAISW